MPKLLSLLPALALGTLLCLLPACNTTGRPDAAAPPATTGPEVALTLRPASFEHTEGWRLIEAPQTETGLLYVGEQALLTELDIVRATVITDADGEPALRLDFTENGARRLYDYSTANTGRPVAFFIDHELVNAPVLQAPMSHAAVIGAALERAEAQRVADALNR